jgi:hypothetical protein
MLIIEVTTLITTMTPYVTTSLSPWSDAANHQLQSSIEADEAEHQVLYQPSFRGP